MEIRASISAQEFKTCDTAALRDRLLVSGLFEADKVKLVYTHEDRIVMGGLMPVNGSLAIEPVAELRCEHFFDSREAALVNIGGTGRVSVDGGDYEITHASVLYVGRGTKQVIVASVDSDNPAKFYLFSGLAHKEYPTEMVEAGHGDIRELGDGVTSNRRTLNRYIHADGIQSCQIVVGVTTLHCGSMWNTMPAHSHDRRTECYLYFDLAPDARVVHLMGEPTETRHLIVGSDETVISPSWSVHSGVGTASYSFVWAMCGENKAYDDMDVFPIADMR